jgi:hypothetical protein
VVQEREALAPPGPAAGAGRHLLRATPPLGPLRPPMPADAPRRRRGRGRNIVAKAGEMGRAR